MPYGVDDPQGWRHLELKGLASLNEEVGSCVAVSYRCYPDVGKLRMNYGCGTHETGSFGWSPALA